MSVESPQHLCYLPKKLPILTCQLQPWDRSNSSGCQRHMGLVYQGVMISTDISPLAFLHARTRVILPAQSLLCLNIDNFRLRELTALQTRSFQTSMSQGTSWQLSWGLRETSDKTCSTLKVFIWLSKRENRSRSPFSTESHCWTHRY
jgi:hypothetical protein